MVFLGGEMAPARGQRVQLDEAGPQEPVGGGRGGEDAADRYRAPALDKGLDILELLAATEEGLSQAEIAKALERTPNEIYRMLDRLLRRHYVARTPSDRYMLTLKLFTLAHHHAPMRRLVDHALPEMRAFAQRSRQSCHIAIFERGQVVVIGKADSPNNWGLSIRTGTTLDLYSTASGHVLLAFSSPAERSFMMEQHAGTPGEKAPDDLDARLAIVAERGHASMESAQSPGMLSLSAPILGPGGVVIAALSCPYLPRLDLPDTPSPEQVVADLCRTAAQIAPAAGHDGGSARLD